ncbi:Uncharacterized membrane protein [Actinopolymorpha cephalotaxi]|uniref:Membrane protein n=1 Tax=Actinopolymorpha cephalotaxi TaxID=504797 RepID=A0A1I2N6N2_9ACTN|nr:DUF1622 domain-containing protein [Actinopolymorpha cephalotaxi]NYH85664.1 putative membrane protein [Actinopolymorpha cephalotaxi]SFF99253.1 Uncharacterized membrane protein [Actinopolymorpha cephalotaxi]
MFDLLSEEFLREVVSLLVRLVEAAGALIIFVGAAFAFVRFVTTALRRRGEEDFNAVRLFLGRYLTLGLEFQLAGDVLRTAVSPTFAQIGQLAAIAAIRTGLNYILGKEIERERAALAESGRRPGLGPGPGALGGPGGQGPAGDG